MPRPRTFLSLAVATLALVVGSPMLASGAPPPATGWQFTIDPTPVPPFPPLGPTTASTCGQLEGEWKSADGTAWQMPAVGTSSSWGDLTLNYWKLTRDAERAVTLEHYAALPPDGVPKVTHRGSAPIVPTPAGTCRPECPVGGAAGAASAAQQGCDKPRLSDIEKQKLSRSARVEGESLLRYQAAYREQCQTGIKKDNFWQRIKLCWQMEDSLRIMTRSWIGLWKLANDPPDPEFRSIAKPQMPRARRVRASGRLSRRDARTVNGMVKARSKAAGLRAALLTSIERASGALVYGGPGDAGFERQQMLAAAGYANQLAKALGQLRSRSAAAGRSFKRAKVSFKVDADAVRAEQKRIAEQGLPGGAKRWGLSAEQHDALRNGIVSTDPAKLAKGFPGAFASREQLASLRDEAKLLRAFSARVRQNPTAPVS